MRSTTYPVDPVKEVARAHTDLVLLGTIRSLAESSDLTSNRNRTAERIIKACDAEMARCLRDYDAWKAKVAPPIPLKPTKES